MKLNYLILTAMLILFSCEYKASYEDGDETDVNADLTTWGTDAGIDVALSDSSSDQAAGVYKLTLVNLLDDESSNFSGGTAGNWLPSTAVANLRKAPTVFQVITDPSDDTNKLLELQLKREPLIEYVYHEITITEAMRGYIFKFDYRSTTYTPVDLYLSLGVNDLSDDKEFTYDIEPGSSGSAAIEMSILKAGTYYMRFGMNGYAPTFSGYFDNIAFFESSNHSVYTTVSIEEDGIYFVSVKARSVSSDYCTVKISGETKTFTLTDAFTEYGWYVRLDKGDVSFEIMPVDFLLSNRFPGSIEITEPKLAFYPDKSEP